MNITIVTPAAPRTRKGNRVTAVRWSRLLRQLGHRVVLRQEFHGESCDLLVALHAQRSFPAVERFHSSAAGVPLIVALTGTDLYRELRRDPKARQALAWAWRLVVLQPLGVQALPRRFRAKARVIQQSSEPPPAGLTPDRRVFQVCAL